MDLTPEGAAAAMLGVPERAPHAAEVLSGSTNISKYTRGVCYEAAAFTRFLLGALSHTDIDQTSGNAWIPKFAFLQGKRWKGQGGIDVGSAVGFYRLIDKKFFHVAIGVGGTTIRAVNGHALGQGWSKVDLKEALGKADDDGNFDYDNTKIQVWVSRV